ncbi:hypothetical protein TWF718_009774 [Orbilia javanica]|uniref:Uncharacterized protein n=1 Tax=Orbilia javanica TaxID=47235 RepID=A0AAN8RBQ2_9PEZI
MTSNASAYRQSISISGILNDPAAAAAASGRYPLNISNPHLLIPSTTTAAPRPSIAGITSSSSSSSSSIRIPNQTTTPTVQEIIQSASKEELQNLLAALIKSDPKNSRRIQTFHSQKLQLLHQRQQQQHQRQRAEAEARLLQHQANNALPNAATSNASNIRILNVNPPAPAAVGGGAGGGGAGGTNININTPNSTRKRKAEAQISVCITCLQPYDEAENDETACISHPGPWDADLDHEMWFYVHKGDDRDHNHEDFFNDCPEAFVMECCGGRGDSVGCRIDRHLSRFRQAVAYVGPQEGFHPSAGSVGGTPRRVRVRQVPYDDDDEGDEDEDEDGDEYEY